MPGPDDLSLMKPPPIEWIPTTSLEERMAQLRNALVDELTQMSTGMAAATCGDGGDVAKGPATAKRGTIAVDFDGVIHSYSSKWTTPEEIPDPIVDGAIEFLLAALGAGCEVVIYSTRAATESGRDAIRQWLRREAGGAWWPTPAGPGIESVKVSGEKPPAIVYLDDRAWRFDGTFPPIADLLAFKPWNRA